MKCWVCIEAGQLDSAAVLVADLIEQAERHGLEQFRVIGAILQASVSGLAALGADELEPTRPAHRITTMTTFVDTSRMVGLNLYLTFNDAVLGRLLMAAAQPEQARNRLDTGLRLAKDTGMCFYDAEFLRLRAHTHTDPEARRADLGAALALARRQGAPLVELRAALDDFELRGEPARGPSRRRQLLPEGRRVARTRAGPSQPLGTFPTTLRQALKPRAETRTPLKEYRTFRISASASQPSYLEARMANPRREATA